MTIRYHKTLCGIFFLAALMLPGSILGAETPENITVEHAYPGFASGILKGASIVAMKKGTLVATEGIEIRESHLKETVEKADPKIREELKKNLFFILEQETMKAVLVKEAIQQVLIQQKRQDAFASYLQGLGEKTNIRVNMEWVKAQHALVKDNPVDKARMSGKPAMIEFGATGCVPCDMMQPILESLRKKYPDKLNVVFVHVGEN